jgi:dethiobiotin synthase
MFRGIFVTGTDTCVGKTVVSAALMLRYRAEAPLRYWKPVQTGIEQGDDSAEVARLASLPARKGPAYGYEEILACGVRLPRPVSPHLAARLSGRAIAIQPLVDVLGAQPSDARWIVEGAGGALVPLNDRETMADLMIALALPVLVVARSTLGTINHTWLTIEALRRRELAVAGVVMVGPPDDENRAAIERYGETSVVATMPRFDPLTSDRLASWVSTGLDPDGRLLELLR